MFRSAKARAISSRHPEESSRNDWSGQRRRRRRRRRRRQISRRRRRRPRPGWPIPFIRGGGAQDAFHPRWRRKRCRGRRVPRWRVRAGSQALHPRCHTRRRRERCLPRGRKLVSYLFFGLVLTMHGKDARRALAVAHHRLRRRVRAGMLGARTSIRRRSQEMQPQARGDAHKPASRVTDTRSASASDPRWRRLMLRV